MDSGRSQKMPLSARVRRCSAPTTLPENASLLPEIPLRREWMTKHQAVWRTGPSPLSQKLGDVPGGLRVIESKIPHSFPMQCEDDSWIAIVPKGYIQTADLSAVTCGDYSESALAALREEGVRLREVNVGLREQELLARAELEKTQQSVSSLRSELDSLREQLAMEKERCAAEQSCFERCYQRRLAMERKLVVCADAVRTTVDCIDRFNAGTAVHDEVKSAGIVIADLLECSPSFRPDGEKVQLKEAKASPGVAEQKASTSRLFPGQENDAPAAHPPGKDCDTVIDMKAEEKLVCPQMCTQRIPLQTMNE